MTKTELMETYTAEQLAEMVIAGEQIGEILMDVITGGNNKIPIEECKIVKRIRRDENGIWLNVEDADFIQNYSKMQKTISNNQSEVAKLNSEVEKYRKAFEDAKKERDCQIAEYQKKIEELTSENKKCLEQIMASIPLLYGYSVSEVARAIFEHCNSEAVRMSNKNRFDYGEGAEKTVKDGCEIYILSLIKCLQGLCAGENYTEENVLTKFVPTEPIKVAEMLITAKGECEPLHIGNDVLKDTYRIFDVPELRQIAEYLLVYCNHNEEA